MEGTAVAVAGCTGEMGRRLVRCIAANPAFRLTGALTSSASSLLGQDAGIVAGVDACDVAISADPESAFSGADVVIDFSAPVAAPRNASVAAATGIGLVLATTGLDDPQQRSVRAAAARAPVLVAPNLSPALNVMIVALEHACALLGETYDAEVLGVAHRRKRDAPSGGAMEIARAIARGRGIDLDANAIRTRDGDTGPRPTGAIGFSAVRGGNGAGEHTALLMGEFERLEFTHRVGSRTLYAETAIAAACWLRAQPAGLYRMEDFLRAPGRT